MPQNIQQKVTSLKLDLNNFRTVPQKNEYDAVNAMISINPEKFWGLMESILDDGFLYTENILVIQESKTKLVVKEGNRRIASLKIIYGILDNSKFNIPSSLSKKIKQISVEWKSQNKTVPCLIFDKSETALVDKFVSLTHGKGEKASRDKWPSVATARHNRDMNGSSEPALDLLEKYLSNGKNITSLQKERWAGDYAVTLLEEAIKKIIPRISVQTVPDLIASYPNIKERAALEEVLRQIGLNSITFNILRDVKKDILEECGIPLPQSTPQAPPAAITTVTPTPFSTNSSSTSTSPSVSSPTQGSSTNNGSAPITSAGSSQPAPVVTPKATREKTYAISDPKNVKSLLKKFNPRGVNGQKVITLKNEAESLDITKTPIAFCFLLRSMFEISAKNYCGSNSIPLKTTKVKNGVNVTNDKTLLELLKETAKHLTQNSSDKELTKELHGAITELGKKDGILSVTSMNQLVHNPSFSIIPGDVCTLFSNVFPLLKHMN